MRNCRRTRGRNRSVQRARASSHGLYKERKGLFLPVVLSPVTDIQSLTNTIEIFSIILFFVCFAQNHNCCIGSILYLKVSFCSTKFVLCVPISPKPDRLTIDLIEERRQDVIVVGVVARAAGWWRVEIWRIQVG